MLLDFYQEILLAASTEKVETKENTSDFMYVR